MSEVQVFEVSLRDGLQNESGVVTTEQKLDHLYALMESGAKDIEVTSFVRPSRIPQLADAAELCRQLPSGTDVNFWALVPNQIGMDRAMSAGLGHVCTVLSASTTHNQRNLNRTTRESLHGIRGIMETARAEGCEVRAYISTVFGCPYEGYVAPEKVVELAQKLLEEGASVVALGDTTGVGLPDQVTELVGLLASAGLPLDRFALHAHDTRGTALTNVYAGYLAGLRRFDGSVAGIGGCPYAPGAAGNVATEDLVNLFEGMGISTGYDLGKLAQAGFGMSDILGRELPGRMHAYLAKQAEASRRSA